MKNQGAHDVIELFQCLLGSDVVGNLGHNRIFLLDFWVMGRDLGYSWTIIKKILE